MPTDNAQVQTTNMGALSCGSTKECHVRCTPLSWHYGTYTCAHYLLTLSVPNIHHLHRFGAQKGGNPVALNTHFLEA